ncbi:MAG: hypothetical protein IKG79_01955 [Neisseriaceae bacterium]|nr:hypothetical protein [Neisseriaceae bacterium]
MSYRVKIYSENYFYCWKLTKFFFSGSLKTKFRRSQNPLPLLRDLTKLSRGNLLTTSIAPNPHSDKGIATPATQARNDGVDCRVGILAHQQHR